MIEGLLEKAGEMRGMIVDQIRVGFSCIKVKKSEVTPVKEIIKGKATEFVEYNGRRHEIVGFLTNEYEIKVDKKDYYSSYSKGVDYFVFPDKYIDVLGYKPNSIDIILNISGKVEDVLRVFHMKFEGRKLACKGDGKTARRLNPLSKEPDPYETVPCICSNSRYFEEEIIDEVKLLEHFRKELGDGEKLDDLLKQNGRTVPKKKKVGEDWKDVDVRQFLLQGAWRDVELYDKEKNLLKVIPRTKYSCDVRYGFDFLIPELPGINKFTFEGNGLWAAAKLAQQIMEFQELFGGHVNSIPLQLKVMLDERVNPRTHEKFIYPKIYFHFPYSIKQLMASETKKLTNPQYSLVDKETGDEIENAEILE